jgi:flavodoxin I
MFRFDDSDPRYLIAYDSDHEADIANYHELMRRWTARFERGDIFGVVLVTEPHEHPEGEDEHAHERNTAFEEAFSRLLTDFRRDHKADVARCTVGYARVIDGTWLSERLAAAPAALDEMRASTDRMARYMWGVPGSLFGDVAEARAWIDAQIAAFVPPAAVPTQDVPTVMHSSSRRVGLFYGSTTGMTEIAALKIAQAWVDQGMEPILAVNIGEVKDLSALLAYDYLILGIPTWNVGQLQDDWEIALPQLDALDFTGKQVALFGVGDQYGYPDNYLDAVGILGAKLIERGATLVGRWNAEGYEFSTSKALIDGSFVGLALDEVQQSTLSNPRIQQWVAQVITEFALQPQRI